MAHNDHIMIPIITLVDHVSHFIRLMILGRVTGIGYLSPYAVLVRRVVNVVPT